MVGGREWRTIASALRASPSVVRADDENMACLFMQSQFSVSCLNAHLFNSQPNRLFYVHLFTDDVLPHVCVTGLDKKVGGAMLHGGTLFPPLFK